MGKTGKWLRNLLTGKKGKEKYATNQNPSNANENPISSTTPKEKRRWSFRRPSTSASSPSSKQFNSAEVNVTTTPTLLQTAGNTENVQKKHFTDNPNGTATSTENEEAAAIKIQSAFRSYLARQALCALRGIVKLQALVRGHLVRKQATATLRCMQALLTAQGRACAQRIRMASEGKSNQRQLTHRNTTHENLFWHLYTEMDRGLEENIKIVEMDVSESKGHCRSRKSNTNYTQHNGCEHRFSTYYPSPAASAQSSPASKRDDAKLPFTLGRPAYAQCATSHNSLVPNYMANTESSRAKFRSHSAPKQRTESIERQPSRRRASMEGRNMRRPMRMQRSSSHVGTTSQNYQYPWSINLDRSTVSLIDSECGSASTVRTNANYCRSLAAYDPHEDRY